MSNETSTLKMASFEVKEASTVTLCENVYNLNKGRYVLIEQKYFDSLVDQIIGEESN
jgi:hypothetical protein